MYALPLPHVPYLDFYCPLSTYSYLTLPNNWLHVMARMNKSSGDEYGKFGIGMLQYMIPELLIIHMSKINKYLLLNSMMIPSTTQLTPGMFPQWGG